MVEAVIVAAVRTAIGSFGGTLKDVPVVKLGSISIKAALNQTRLKPAMDEESQHYVPSALKDNMLAELEQKFCDWHNSSEEVTVDEVIMGNVLQGGQGMNTARQAAIYAGIPKETVAFTVNKVCGSGLKAVSLGAQSIRTGEAEVVIAGGMENMSSAPYILPKARWGYRMNTDVYGEIVDLMVYDGLWEIFYGCHMGLTAENIAKKTGISRREQDEISLLSHERARKAIAQGVFKQEIAPVQVPQRKGELIFFETDERPMDTTMEKMAALPPVFKKDGTVTAGNSSGINDAAAAVVLMSREKAEDIGLEILGTIKSYAAGGVDPAYMGLGPIPAIRKALDKAGLTIRDIDIVDLNEAFAAQFIACIRELNIGLDNTNVHGSGIALGHPIGATGTRQTVTMLHEMRRRSLKRGLVSMCIGGGQGMAMVIERE